MDLAEVKNMIKSLITAAGGCCSIQELLIDFEEETGFQLPHFNFYNPRDFLLTLTDIIKVFNSGSGEWVVLARSSIHRNRGVNVQRQVRTHIRPNERPNFNVVISDFADANQQGDINLFIRAYQMGWITLNESIRWEKVPSRVGLEQDDTDADNIEFLFSNEEKDDVNEISERRSTIRRFLARINFVKDPTNFPPYARPINYPLPYTCASTEIQNNLKNLMMFQVDPISWRQLPDIYFQFYDKHFCSRDYGYRTLLEMCKALKYIFRCVRLKQDDWILFDASKSPDSDEEKMYIWALRNFPNDIINRIITLLDTYCEITLQPGIPKDDFLAHYYKKYRTKLDFTRYGFPDFKSLVSKLNGKIFKVEDFGRDVIIRPLIEKSKLGKRTIFTLCPGDEAFSELFPIEYVGYGAKYHEMNPQCYFRLCRQTKVNIADVYSPHKFYVQLKKYEKCLTDLMNQMQRFYNFQENKCRMPGPTIRPNQICVALYTYEGQSKWCRAIILKVLDKNNVVVFLVDFGSEVKIDNEYIRFLHSKFYLLPKQGFLARICNIKSPVEGKWPLGTRNDFVRVLRKFDVKFKLMRYDQKADILLGILYVFEDDGLESVTTKLVEASGARMRHNEDQPFDAEENAGPCLELVPIAHQKGENREKSDMQLANIESSDDYFEMNEDFYDSSGDSSPESMEIVFDRFIEERPVHRARTFNLHFYSHFFFD